MSSLLFVLCLLSCAIRGFTASSTNSGPVPGTGADTSWLGSFSETWVFRLLSNILGYSVILVPVFVFVVVVKQRSKQLHSFVHNRFVQVFVYGRTEDGVSHAYSALPVTHSDVVLGAQRNRSWLSWLPQPQTRFGQDLLALGYCFVGLQLSYLTWGLLQEKIMTQQYPMEIGVLSHRQHISANLISFHKAEHENGPVYSIKFRNSQFLVFINRLLAFIIAFSVLSWQNRAHLLQYFLYSRQPALYAYSYCALTNILSSWCQYEALKFVSFPVQILSKGMKTLAVMVMSQFLRGKRYKRTEWAFTLAISVGIWLFLLNEQSEQSSKHHSTSDQTATHHLTSGVIILGLYLTFDSFTTNWQASLFETYQINSLHMMLMTNMWSIILTSSSLLAQSDLMPAFELLLLNSALLRDCVLLSICSAIGQLFIFFTISRFGAVVFTLIMTLRQVFAILLSIFIYAHSISIFGTLGIIVVFSSLFSQMYFKYRQNHSNKTKASPDHSPPKQTLMINNDKQWY